MRTMLLTTVVLAILGLVSPRPAAAQSATAPVRVSVTNVATQQGFVMAALYDESAWGGRAVAVARAPASAETVALVLQAPTPGRYAVRLFHDVDADGALDANLMGIPSEPFGFSNNAPVQFGPPAFAAAAFDVAAGGADQSIALR